MFYHLNLSVNSEQKHSVGGRIMPFESQHNSPDAQKGQSFTDKYLPI